ncbi:MAG: PAC2 family protein [Thermoplasmata archaeon]|nr:PAC2 family protein [Thermoplasmata archaeon]
MPLEWRSTDASAPPFAPGGIVVSSFPSAGLAATVAGHYIVKTLKLPRIGVFDGTDSQPIAVVQNGQVHPPIRVYGRPDLAVVLSELPVPPDLAFPLAQAILTGAEQRKARLVIGLEGVMPHPSEAPGAPTDPPAPNDETVWATCAREEAGLSAELKRANARRLEDGVIGGLSGGLLIEGITRPTPVAVLLVSASTGAEGFPDHRAGAALIETLDRMLPELKIDTGPLRTQAEVIEKALRAAMKARARSVPEAPPEQGQPTIYG